MSVYLILSANPHLAMLAVVITSIICAAKT